jgi:hypothetical protein
MRRTATWVGIVLLVAASVLGACDRPDAYHATPANDLVLLTFEQQGGIAGFEDKLILGHGGEYYLVREGSTERIGSLQPERRGQLEGWREGVAAFRLKLQDNPGGPDNLVRQLVWAGQGSSQPTEAQQREILDWATQLMGELSGPER